ncbi:hypothetical protein KBB27_00175 [Patescibacteria group bacterium]|nr:hypothetical protein [Patescibacteria group bacterium]
MSNQLSGTKPGVSAQKFLDISEIREDLILMKDGTLRAVLAVSSINFALKSGDEQNAIVQAYMQFLNGLDFPIQVLIQSRKMNIDGYLQRLAANEKGLGSDLLKGQIRDYTEFIKQLVKMGDIMQKRFFVVIPYNPLGQTAGQKKFSERLSDVFSPRVGIKLSEERFKKYKFELSLRVSQIAAGLSSMSLNAVPLDTQSLIELFYTVYNPELFEHERMTNLSDLQIEG